MPWWATPYRRMSLNKVRTHVELQLLGTGSSQRLASQVDTWLPAAS